MARQASPLDLTLTLVHPWSLSTTPGCPPALEGLIWEVQHSAPGALVSRTPSHFLRAPLPPPSLPRPPVRLSTVPAFPAAVPRAMPCRTARTAWMENLVPSPPPHLCAASRYHLSSALSADFAPQVAFFLAGFSPPLSEQVIYR